MIISKELKRKLIQLAVELNVGGNEDVSHLWLLSALYQMDPTEYQDKEVLAEELFPEYEDAINEEVSNGHFRCESCSWWFEHHEAGDEEGNCIDCV